MKLRLKIITESLNEGANITSSDFVKSETLFDMYEVTKLFKIKSDDMEMTQELSFQYSPKDFVNEPIIAALEKCGRGNQVEDDSFGQHTIPTFDISFKIVEMTIGGKEVEIKDEYTSNIFPNKMVAISFLRNIAKSINDFASQNDDSCFVFSGGVQSEEQPWDTSRRTKIYYMMLKRAFKRSSGWVMVSFGEDEPNDTFFFRCNDDNASSQNEIYSLIDEEFSSMK